MGGIFSSLHISNTGLQANQLMVDTASNNISNANNEFYSRQKVMAMPEKSIFRNDVFVGRGVDAQSIQRVHDEFIFERYAKAKEDEAFADTEYARLKQIAELFPDIDKVGINNDLEEYFNAWKDLANNPSNPAQRQTLVQKTITLTTNIQNTRQKLQNLQIQTSQELEVNVREVNQLTSEIAKINQELATLESRGTQQRANSLRDKRDELEFHLRELIGSNITRKNLFSDARIDKNSVEFDDVYTLNIARGFSLIDGANAHKIVIKNDGQNSLSRVAIQGYDFKEVDITQKLKDGKIGALISIYNDGKNIGKIGKIQQYIDALDSFARGFIEASNQIYSQGATNELYGVINPKIDPNAALKDTSYNIKSGSFDLVAYNADGIPLARKTIKIDKSTSMLDVVRQINSNTDDNKDNNQGDDLDDYFSANYSGNELNNYLKIEPKDKSKGHFIAIEDNGTNFSGALGVNGLFKGTDARNIELLNIFQNDPNAIKINKTPSIGNFEIANDMRALQYNNIDFYNGDKTFIPNMKISEFYQNIVGKIADDTTTAKNSLDTKSAILEAIKNEHLSISQVSIDEEMVNLIKFQGGYAANAKVISSIDKMIDTLLSIKQ